MILGHVQISRNRQAPAPVRAHDFVAGILHENALGRGVHALVGNGRLALVNARRQKHARVVHRQILPGVGAAPRQIAAHGRTGIAHLRPIVGKRKAAFRQTIDLLFGQLQIENAAQQRIERRSVFKKRPQLSGLAGFR